MGNWNTKDSSEDYGYDYGYTDTTPAPDDKERIAYISPTTGGVSTGNWNVRQAKESGTQSAKIGDTTYYGSNAALAALGDPSSQFRENVIAGYPAYMANKRAEQLKMDRLIGTDLSSKIKKAADALGIPHSEIGYLQGESFDESFTPEEGTAIRFSAGRGEDIGLKDERSFGQKVSDFFDRKARNVVEGGGDRDFIIGVYTDPETGFSTYSNPYQIVSENNLMDAIVSGISPFGAIDTKRLRDPVTGKYYSYSDYDLPFGIDKFAGIMAPQIQEEQLAKAQRAQQLEVDTGGQETPLAIQPTQQARVSRPPMLGGFGPSVGLGLGLGFGDPSFYTSGIPLIRQMGGLLK